MVVLVFTKGPNQNSKIFNIALRKYTQLFSSSRDKARKDFIYLFYFINVKICLRLRERKMVYIKSEKDGFQMFFCWIFYGLENETLNFRRYHICLKLWVN